ncbi:CAP protein [Teladorsagia circumcincta]|uniref:CAP protein n=1 Tax=Teladorsagia circumcincta TaxID=45464 RepID=A0A2G9URJ8_TELCI|nr:CAP protein [Teladorsagia circumcincta]
MSSLSLDHSRINAANAFYDQGMPPQQLALTDFAQGYSVSPESNMYRTTNPPTRNVQQSSLPASVEHIADVEESFPEIDAKRSGHTPWDGRSNAPVRNSYGGAALLAELGNSDEFRWKLRRQREKIKDYRRQIDSENNTLNVEVPYEKFGDSKVAWRNGNANRRGSFTQSNTYPKSVLYKTHSDSSLFQDLDYAPYPSLNPESTQIPPRTADSIRPPEGFGRMPSPAERRAPMEGFFAPKPRQDPVWVTSPPPPFQIQEDIRMPKSFYYSSKQQIHLPYSRELSAPAPDLDQGNMMNFGVNQWTEEPPPSTYNLAPTNLSFAVEPNQVPMEQHNPEIGASNTAGRLQFATIETEPSRVLPRSSLEMPSLCKTSLHEYIAKRRGHSGHHSTHGPGRSSSHNVPEVPVGISHAPPTNLQSSSERNSPTRDFNEQGSTYPVGTNFMRGLFGNSLGNGGVVRSIPRTSRKAQILQKERSFAIISRPLTPPAILQNVSDVVDLGSQYRPSAASESLDKMRRGSDPVSPPVCAVSRPESDSFNRNLGSPLSPYDSESEERFRSNQTVLNIPSNQAQLIGTPPAHGILLKNHEGVTRPSKKVVFQCDSLEADRCLQTNVNSTEAPPHVRAYDAALADVIENWSTLSDQIGGDVKLMREKVTAVFSSLRIFLWTAACQAEPSADEVQRLVSPIVNLLSDINRFKDSKRKAPQFNHLCAVAEGIPAVGWVLVKKTPAAHVKEMLEASMFYVNRVLKEFKDGDQKNIEWARSWKNLLETMHTFVRQTHTTGLEWNSAPSDLGTFWDHVVSKPNLVYRFLTDETILDDLSNSLTG